MPILFHVLVLVQGRRKRLSVDDHDVDTRITGEGIQLIQVAAVIDEEARLPAVVLHEVVRRDFKGLLHALTDGDARNHNDELAPAIALIQLEQGLDVDVGLARAGLHLDIQRAPSHRSDELGGWMNVALVLERLDIAQNLLIRQMERLVLKAGVIAQVLYFRLASILFWRQQAQLYARSLKGSDITPIGHANGSDRKSVV